MAEEQQHLVMDSNQTMTGVVTLQHAVVVDALQVLDVGQELYRARLHGLCPPVMGGLESSTIEEEGERIEWQYVRCI